MSHSLYVFLVGKIPHSSRNESYYFPVAGNSKTLYVSILHGSEHNTKTTIMCTKSKCQLTVVMLIVAESKLIIYCNFSVTFLHGLSSMQTVLCNTKCFHLHHLSFVFCMIRWNELIKHYFISKSVNFVFTEEDLFIIIIFNYKIKKCF